jgi:hypothetical protein
MSMRRRLAALSLIAVVALFAASCGSDDGGDEDAGDTTTTEAEETTTSTEAEETTTTEAAEEEPAETSEPSDGETSGEMPTVEDIEGIDDFCTVWTMGESSSDFGNVDGASPEQIQQTAQVLNALLVQGVATAPDEIKDDFTAMATSVQDFYAILADYEYDFTALGQASANDPELAERMEAIYSPELESQTANVEAWVAANC